MFEKFKNYIFFEDDIVWDEGDHGDLRIHKHKVIFIARSEDVHALKKLTDRKY